jgi:hypothetical protein
MKKIATFSIAFATLFACNTLNAQSYKTALGIRLSSRDAVVNNSVSFKQFLNQKTALEALFTFDKKAALGALIEIHKELPGTEGLYWLYGGGAYLGFDADKTNPSRSLMGLQGVVGLDYKFSGLPINLSLDWKPELNIIDNINFEPAALALSIRFTFGK